MAGVTGAIIGGSLISGAASIFGSRSASSAATNATASAVAESRRQFDITRGDLQPFITTGQNALGQLSRLYGLGDPNAGNTIGGNGGFDPRTFAGGRTLPGGRFGGRIPPQLAGPTSSPQPAGPDLSAFFESPDFQFNRDQGQQAIDRSLAARGKALSGQGVKEGERFASGLASREFGSFFDRLATLAGIGNTGAAQSAAAGSTSASQVGNAMIAGGAANANSRMSAAAGVNSALQGGISNLLLMRFLGQSGSPAS